MTRLHFPCWLYAWWSKGHKTQPTAVLPLHCSCNIRLALARGSLLLRLGEKPKLLPFMGILAVWQERDPKLGGEKKGLPLLHFISPYSYESMLSPKWEDFIFSTYFEECGFSWVTMELTPKSLLFVRVFCKLMCKRRCFLRRFTSKRDDRL